MIREGRLDVSAYGTAQNREETDSDPDNPLSGATSGQPDCRGFEPDSFVQDKASALAWPDGYKEVSDGRRVLWLSREVLDRMRQPPGIKTCALNPRSSSTTGAHHRLHVPRASTGDQ
jgi:hypothetical protein